MCGRFVFAVSPEWIRERFQVPFVPEVPPRYNVAPTDPILAVRVLSEDPTRREAVFLRWGLVPAWAQEPTIGARMINARAETVAQRPAFRRPFRSRRCIVPLSGFYEWKQESRGKQPYYVCHRSGQPLAVAGIWDRWEGSAGEAIESCALITVPSNRLLEPIHDRMPALLKPEEWSLWLDPRTPLETVQDLLRPYPDEELRAYPVTRYVNDPRHEGPECIRPLEEFRAKAPSEGT